MSSFTNSLEDGKSFEDEFDKFYLKMAQEELKSARDRKDYIDVDDYVKEVRSWAKCANVSLADLGTSEEELAQLVQTGYKSEARTCFEIAQDMDMFRHSRLHLYAREVKNIGYCFFKKPNFCRLKTFLAALFYFRRPHTRQYYIARTREYLAKAKLSPSDIGTDEAKLVQLGS